MDDRRRTGRDGRTVQVRKHRRPPPPTRRPGPNGGSGSPTSSEKSHNWRSDKARELLNLGKTGDAQRAMITAAIGVDKAQLLSGHATSRTETIAPDRNPEYEEVLDRTIRLVQDKAS